MPPEVRRLIYEYLLVSPLPLPPAPPQSEQHVHAAILRVNRSIYLEAIDLLYGHNSFIIHLRSRLHQLAYEPFLSALTAANARKIKEVDIVLWGNFTEDDGDTVSFGTEDFGIALQNLIYCPKLVVSIDIVVTNIEEDDDASTSDSTNFCAFDWLVSTFANEWYFDNICFDLFRAVARFHMKRMFDRPVQECESRWFAEARADLAMARHERRKLWELEDRYGLAHEEDENRPAWSGNNVARSGSDDQDANTDEEEATEEDDEGENRRIDESNQNEDKKSRVRTKVRWLWI